MPSVLVDARHADILQYQSSRLGRSNGETLLAELMPLAAKNITTWYANKLKVPELRSRGEYRKALAPARIAHLKEKILQHQPHVVRSASVERRNLVRLFLAAT